MDLQLINAVVSGLAILGVWLITRPQQVENEALHKSIDNNTKALKELTDLINQIRIEQAGIEQSIDNMWHRIKDLRADVNELRRHTGCEHCKAKEND